MTTTSYMIGRTTTWSYFITGYYDQFRVTKAARYSGNFTPSLNVNPH